MGLCVFKSFVLFGDGHARGFQPICDDRIRVYIPIEPTLDVVDTLCIVEVFDCKGLRGLVWGWRGVRGCVIRRVCEK